MSRAQTRIFPRSKSSLFGGALYHNIALLFPSLSVLIVVNIVPILYTLINSLQYYHLAYPNRTSFVGLSNYFAIFSDERFWNSLGVSMKFMFGSLSIELVLGTLIALLLFKQVKRVGVIRGALLLPLFLSPIVVAFLWRLLFSPSLGLLNYYLGFLGLEPYEWIYSPKQVLFSIILVEVWQKTPELVLIIYTGLLGLSDDVVEAALVDGACSWKLFWTIKVPMIKPILMVGVLFRVIDLAKSFDVIYILTRGGPGISSETLALYAYTTGFSFLRMGYASALGLVLFAIIVVLSIVIVRWGEVDFQ